MAEESEFEVMLAESFGQALGMVESALKAEGFSIVTRFDVQRTMNDRLHINFRPFTILGTVNDRIASRALNNDPCIALMMPCNISLEVDSSGQTLVRVADPAQLISCKCGEDPELQEIAEDASQRLIKVVKALKSASRPLDPEGKPWTRLAVDTHE
jgi:uncharacterized protein (DUF302 family)